MRKLSIIAAIFCLTFMVSSCGTSACSKASCCKTKQSKVCGEDCTKSCCKTEQKKACDADCTKDCCKK